MKHRSCGNAALVAFAAHLLDVDDAVATASSAARPPSLRSSPPMTRSHHRKRPLAFFAHTSSSSRSRGRRRGGVGGTGGRPPSPSSSSSLAGTTSRTFKRRSTRRVDAAQVAPLHYVLGASSSSAEESEVLAYRDPNLDGDISLLRPHLEFNELDLHDLFSKERGPAGANSSGVSAGSQLYEEFQEVEIGHFQPPSTGLQREGYHTGRGSGTNSPFFFASIEGEQDQSLSDVSTSDASMTATTEEEETPTLPPWLTINQGRFAPMKLRKLQRDLSPHLSSKEVEEVVSAIHVASRGDEKKVAGAADFCSILVNSLEMTDAPALCAAAFHYSSLVSVREREVCEDDELCPVEDGDHYDDARVACLKTAGSDAKFLCALAGSGIEKFGTHAVKIALDAARLKSMESLANTVLRENGRLGSLGANDARNLRSLLLTVNEEGDWRALAIRSAACLYRLEGLEAYRTCHPGPQDQRRRVSPEESRASQEALHIYAPFAARLGMFRLKTELEDAAFRTLYPRSHAKVSALCGGEKTNSVGEGMRSVLDDISQQMKRLVQEDFSFMENIEKVSVTARVKEPYSVWRKMLKISRESNVSVRELSVLDIPDAVATRVVFSARKLSPDEPDATTKRREEELCYHLYDLCTANWPESADSRFKDYVKNPKSNGYQSLHYSSRKRWRGTEWPFEVQIRSKEMHRTAEYGMAAHWSYKRSGIDGEEQHLDRTSEAYINSVQGWRSKQAAQRVAERQQQRQIFEDKAEEPALYLEEEIRRQRKRDRNKALAPYLEALSGAQTDMTRENVFVFVSVQPPSPSETEAPPPSEGTVLSLPAGSRVLEAIRVAEEWSSALESSGDLYDGLPIAGRSKFVALRNGLRTSSLGSELLESGDVVSIVPSEDLVLSALSSTRKNGSQ